MNDNIKQILDHPNFLKGECWEHQTFRANETIIQQGELTRWLYLIELGAVRVMGNILLNEQQPIKPGISDLFEGQIFGELVLFDREPRSASVKAIQDCQLIAINGDKLLDFLKANSNIGFAFLMALMSTEVQRLRKSNQKVCSLFAWGLKAHKIDEHLD